MFCGIDFMAIWFFFKESVLILLASILTTTFCTDFTKVLTKVKFGPENSLALNEFLEQLLIKHENLEWVDKLQTNYKDIGFPNSGLEMRKPILKRNDHRYIRKRRKLRPYYANHRNHKNKNFNLDELSHLNIDDYENALTGVLKKEGYKQQRVKQKRYVFETPPTTRKYKTPTTFDILDLSIIIPKKKDKTKNYESWIGKNNLRKNYAINKSKRQAIIADDYIEYTERSTNCGPKTNVNIKAEELEELMNVVEPTTKNKSIKHHNSYKNKTLGIMNSKKTELTITRSLDTRQKNYLSSRNILETTPTPILTIVMESSPTKKTLEKKSITKQDSNKAPKVNVPANMISKKTKIQNHLEKNIFLNNPDIEEQIDASPTNANIKSINLNNLHIMTDPYLLRITETTAPNFGQAKNLQKRQNIIEEDPASVMSPEEIRRAKIEAEKLMDVDKDFNERNEPNFNKEVMKTTNNDYKVIIDYWEIPKDKANQKQKNNSEEKILKTEKNREIKQNKIQQNSFFSRHLLHYNYDDDNYENNLYSDYDDQENSLRRYPRDVNENDDYKFENVADDYFDYRNEQPLQRRFYKKRWKKEANSKNNKKGLFNKNVLKNKINKLKNFFGIGHENNYNEKIEDDYPVDNMSIDTANNLPEKPENLQNINEPHDSENIYTVNSFDQPKNFDSNTLDQNSVVRTIFETKTDNSLNSFNSKDENKQTNENPVETNSNVNNVRFLEPPTVKEIQDNNQNSYGQSTVPTKLTSSQSTTTNQNSIQKAWHRNLEISSIVDTSFSNDYSKPTTNALKSNSATKITNTQSSSPKELALYDFTTNLKTTTSSNPLAYSFSYKMSLFDPSSSGKINSPSPKEIVNFNEKMSKRELNFVKKLLARYKTKENTNSMTESLTTVKLTTENLTKNPNTDKINIDKSLTLNNKKNKKKLTHKYKFRHFPRYHSDLKDLLKSLPPQIPVAQMHVDELKLNAIKKNQEKSKKTRVNIKSRETTNYRADLDEEDYILNEDLKKINSEILNNDYKLKHFGQIVKHNIENENDSKKCANNKHKTHKHRPDLEEEKNAMKVAGQQKIEDNLKSKNNKKENLNSYGNTMKQDKEKTAEETNNMNSLQTMNINNDKTKIDNKQDTKLFYTDRNNVQQNVLKHSCQSSSANNTICTSCPTTTKACSTKHLTTKCPATTVKYPSKKTCKTTCPTTTHQTPKTTCTTSCKSTTCPTTCKITTFPTKCKTTTCPTTCKKTTCPTTCKTTTCPTTCKKTTCKTTTCPTTCKKTTCKTTTCPTTCRTTTCPTTCRTTTCPTTCRTTTCPTTCKITTCPTTTCKTTTCPPTTCPTSTCKTTSCPTTACKTTTKECPTTCSTSCRPTCPHIHSTHKFGITPWDKINYFLDRPKRKIIHHSQYFNNKNHKAKFNADRVPRQLIFPKKKYLYDNMPRNEYKKMKHKNLISRLKRKYFPRTRERNLIRRKKSINLSKDVEMPIYKVYPKRIRYQRYKRRKMKSDDDDAEDEKQRKVLETIYHHRIQRRRNGPEYVRKSHSYDNTIENNANLPSSYNSEVNRMLIRRTPMYNSNNEDFKGTTASDSTLYSDAIKGKIPAKVVQDLYMDLNKSKNIKNIIGKALRNPRRDPNNPFPYLKKCEKQDSGKQLQQIIDDVMKKLDSVKVTTGDCVKLDQNSHLFLKIITANIKNSNVLENEESDIPAQSMILFNENNLNSSTSNSTTNMNPANSSSDPCKLDKSPTTSSNGGTVTTTQKTTTKKCATTSKTKSTKAKTTKSTTGIPSKCASESSKTNSPTMELCNMKPSETTLPETKNVSSLIELCRTIIISSSDPCKIESSTSDPCMTKSSATTAKTKSPTTKITKTKATTTVKCTTTKATKTTTAKSTTTKTTKTTTVKCPTTKATKTTTAKCTTTKATKTKSTSAPCAEISKPQSTTIKSNLYSSNAPIEKNKGKTWGKPLKLKIEVFKLNDTNVNCEANTTELVNRRKFGVNLKRRMGINRPQTLISPLNVHKETKFNNVQATMQKLPLTHQEVTNLLAMYNKLPVTEKRRNKYIYNYLHTQKLFLERLMLQYKKYNNQHRNIISRKRQNLHERHQHLVWVPNELSGSSENSKYTKLKKRMISDDQRQNFKSRIRRENYFRDIMKTRRKHEASLTKMDEWMKVKNEEYKPQYLNFTF